MSTCRTRAFRAASRCPRSSRLISGESTSQDQTVSPHSRSKLRAKRRRPMPSFFLESKKVSHLAVGLCLDLCRNLFYNDLLFTNRLRERVHRRRDHLPEQPDGHHGPVGAVQHLQKHDSGSSRCTLQGLPLHGSQIQPAQFRMEPAQSFRRRDPL